MWAGLCQSIEALDRAETLGSQMHSLPSLFSPPLQYGSPGGLGLGILELMLITLILTLVSGPLALY